MEWVTAVKRPVGIKAVRWDGSNETWELVLEWKGPDQAVLRQGDALAIDTLERVMTVTKGDWIIKEAQGEIYPCEPEIFAETYDIVLRSSIHAEALREWV